MLTLFKKQLILTILFLLALQGCAVSTTVPPAETLSSVPPASPSKIPAKTPIPINDLEYQSSDPSKTPSMTPIPTFDLEYQSLDPSRWNFYSSEVDFSTRFILDFVIDDDGVLWFASEEGGIIRYRDGKLEQVYTSLQPWSEITDNPIWAISYNDKKIKKLDGDNWIEYSLPADSYDYDLRDIIFLPDQQKVWVATDKEVLSFDGEGWQVSIQETGKFALSPSGELWLFGDTNIWRFNEFWEEVQISASEDHFLPIGHAESCSGCINFLAFAADGSFWILIQFYGFAHIYPDGTWDFYNAPGYLTGAFDTSSGLVARDGTLWLGGWYDEIIHFDGEQWMEYEMPSSAIVLEMIEASDDSLILFMAQSGIIRYQP